MLGIKRAVGAVAITTLTLTGLGVAATPGAQAAPSDPVCSGLQATVGSLTGTGTVGDTLTAVLPTWTGLVGPLGSTVTWLRDGSAFATGPSTYVPVASDVGSSISVQQDVDLLGVGVCSWVSQAVAVVAADVPPAGDPTPPDPTPTDPGVPLDTVLQLVSPLAVTGTPEVGQLLRVAPPDWSLPGVMTTYQWLRNGTAIPSATDATYLPTAQDAGCTLVAEVTGSVAGLADVVVQSDPFRVPELTTVLPTLQQAPRLTGVGAIGEQLRVIDPVFSDMTGITTTYQWLRDSAPIGGATAADYTAQAADVGHALAARVTSTLGQTPLLSTVTAPLRIESLPIVAGTAPGILGSPQVGQTLSVLAPVWTVADVATTYQWQRNGIALPGQTSETYTLTPDDLGQAISVVATATKLGFLDGLAPSLPVTVQKGAAPVPTVAPQLSGVPEVGRTLTVSSGIWGGGVDPLLTYTWLRDGVPIPGATAPDYRLAPADANHQVAAQVTAGLPGLELGTFATQPVHVAKMRSSLSAQLARKAVRRSQHAVLRLNLWAPAGASRTGGVTVLAGRQVVGRGYFRPGHHGVTSVRIVRLNPGVHRLKAMYGGTRTVARSSSKVVRLTVRR
jgi:hypothetical protein